MDSPLRNLVNDLDEQKQFWLSSTYYVLTQKRPKKKDIKVVTSNFLPVECFLSEEFGALTNFENGSPSPGRGWTSPTPTHSAISCSWRPTPGRTGRTPACGVGTSWDGCTGEWSTTRRRRMPPTVRTLDPGPRGGPHPRYWYHSLLKIFPTFQIRTS